MPDTETVEFTVEEEIVVTDKYEIEVPAGLSEENLLRYIRANQRDWNWIEQVSGAKNAPTTHEDTIELHSR